MTRDEILQMPAGREMDAAVYQAIHDGKIDLFMCRRVDGYFMPYVGYPIGHIVPPRYSEDAAAAFEAIDEMCKKHFRWEIGGNFMGLGQKYAAFDSEQWADKNPLYKAFADTISLAISRAILLTVLEETDG